MSRVYTASNTANVVNYKTFRYWPSIVLVYNAMDSAILFRYFNASVPLIVDMPSV